MDKISYNTPYNNTPRLHVIYNPSQGVNPPPPNDLYSNFDTWNNNLHDSQMLIAWDDLGSHPMANTCLWTWSKCLLEACILISKIVYLVWGVLELFVK